jgi:hypothetical protein
VHANSTGTLANRFQKPTVSLVTSDRLFEPDKNDRHCRVRPTNVHGYLCSSGSIVFMVTLNTKVTNLPVVGMFTLSPSFSVFLWLPF